MASLDRVKVLVLGDSGEPLNPRLELPTRPSFQISLTFRSFIPSFLALGSMAEITFKTLKLHFPEDFALVDVVAWREVGGAEPGSFSAFPFLYVRLLGDPSLEYTVNSFIALVKQTEFGQITPSGNCVH